MGGEEESEFVCDLDGYVWLLIALSRSNVFWRPAVALGELCLPKKSGMHPKAKPWEVYELLSGKLLFGASKEVSKSPLPPVAKSFLSPRARVVEAMESKEY